MAGNRKLTEEFYIDHNVGGNDLDDLSVVHSDLLLEFVLRL